MCVCEWTYGGNVLLVNEYMVVLCELVNGHMEVIHSFIHLFSIPAIHQSGYGTCQ